MSLYYEAASILESWQSTPASLKSHIYTLKSTKNPPAKLYALISESAKWSAMLKDAIEASGLLENEKKLTPALALVLSHDHILTRHGLHCPPAHPLALALLRHRTRLAEEFARARVRRGFGSVAALRAHVGSLAARVAGCDAAGEATGATGATEAIGNPGYGARPRWVRCNTLKTTLDCLLAGLFAGYARAERLERVMAAAAAAAAAAGKGKEDEVLFVDEHVPGLVALPPGTDLGRNAAYRKGEVIIQDKASCFPALMMLGASDYSRRGSGGLEREGDADVGVDVGRLGEGDIIDACAAPGNKTTHLAALLHSQLESQAPGPSSTPSQQRGRRRKILAFERSVPRAAELEKMVKIAGAGELVEINAGVDFLTTDPAAARFAQVTGILLDPSCSGSGILGRDEEGEEGDWVKRVLVLPEKRGAQSRDRKEEGGARSKGRKRKRRVGDGIALDVSTEPSPKQNPPCTSPILASTPPSANTAEQVRDLKARLASLSNFQLRLLTHAMRFPAARRIVYSTCSVHVEENEGVVVRALGSKIAKQRGWRLLRRGEMVKGLKRWETRGDRGMMAEFVGEEGDIDADDVADACIRCERGGVEGTIGFFVVGFVRDWEGAEEGREVSLGKDVRDGDVDKNDPNGIGDRGEMDGSTEERGDEWNGFSDDE